MRSNGKLETAVFRKGTDSNIYFVYMSFVPIKWKKGTFTTLIRRTYTACLNYNLLQKELHHLEKSFIGITGYP